MPKQAKFTLIWHDQARPGTTGLDWVRRPNGQDELGLRWQAERDTALAWTQGAGAGGAEAQVPESAVAARALPAHSR